jgi:hypothetical protein
MIRKQYPWPRRGQRFGRLRVLGQAAKQHYFRCVCDCGGSAIVRADHLRTGHTRSCGCLGVEAGKKYGVINGHAHKRATYNPGWFKKGHPSGARLTHGQSRGAGTKTYNCWLRMLSRCYHSTSDRYKYYGARGVRVCDRWNPARGGSYENFLADMGEVPFGLTLGRILDGMLYSKETAEWQTMKDQWSERKGHQAQMILHAFHESQRREKKAA